LRAQLPLATQDETLREAALASALSWLRRETRLQSSKTGPARRSSRPHAVQDDQRDRDYLGLARGQARRLADALIGATPIEHGLTLVTGDVKHFSAVSGLQLEAFAP